MCESHNSCVQTILSQGSDYHLGANSSYKQFQSCTSNSLLASGTICPKFPKTCAWILIVALQKKKKSKEKRKKI